MSIRDIQIERHLNFPATGKPPEITSEEYLARIGRLLVLAGQRGLTHLLVYGDREHFSNLHFLTGYDPRFEEAMLLLGQDTQPTLVVGNEGYEYTRIVPEGIKRELFQSFSLPGQPRGKSRSLAEIMGSAGFKKGAKVGVVGWKPFTDMDVPTPAQWIDAPHYIVAAVIDLVGPENVEAAADLMVHPEYGLRIHLDLKELVLHEMAGNKASGKILQALNGLRPGMNEMEASAQLLLDGEPLAVHPNVNFGAKNVLLGVASPGYDERLEYGTVFNVSIGYRRSLIARMGAFARSRRDLPPAMAGVVEDLYRPYFAAIAVWYESLGLGVSGGQVYEETRKAFGGFSKYGVGLNPGHLIHTDEWTNSLFFAESPYRIKSGMAIQCDIIACPGPPTVGVHIEDGLLVADVALRAGLQSDYPDVWQRIEARRRMVRETLGIKLADEILPTSNIQAMLFPYMADTQHVLAKD